MITKLEQLDLTKQYTYADYLKWKIEDRLELIKGYILKMSAPARVHQAISRNLSRQIDGYFYSKKCEWYAAPFDVRLTKFDKTKDKEIFTVVQPDICVICDNKKLDKRGCLGSPDLIIEIQSPGNTKKEMKDKFELYEESGVREYWIVDSVQNFVLIYYLNEAGKYIGTKPYSQEETFNSVIFPELQVDLTKVFE
ncbi:MAG: Uma2 family endonuclease [Spirosomataceae bacterium]